MSTWRIAVACAVVLVCCLAGPRAGRAARLQTVGCAAVGYTMQVPVAWVAEGGCLGIAAGAVVSSSGPYETQLANTIERHSYWDDARARSSIRNDLTARIDTGIVLPVTAPQFQIVAIHGRRFVMAKAAGKAAAHPGTRPFRLVVYEMETFVSGYMYKFLISMIVKTGSRRAIAAQQQAALACWQTIVVTGPR